MIAKIFAKYRNMLIRNKIIVVFIPIVVLPLLVVVYTSNYIFMKSTIQKTKVSITGESSLIVNRIQSIYSNVETCDRVLIKEINNAYKETDVNFDDPISVQRLRNQIASSIDFALRAFKDIESIAFIDTHSNIYASDNRLENNLAFALNSEMVKEIKRPGVPVSIWFPMQTRNFLVTDSHSPVFTIGRRIDNINTIIPLGILILNIKEATISSIFPDEETLVNGGYSIINNEATIISSRTKTDLLKPIQNKAFIQQIQQEKNSITEIKIDKVPYIITLWPIQGLDWRLINRTSLSEMTKDTNGNSLIIFVVGILCIFLALYGSFSLSRVIAKPIIQLTRVAKQISKGNLNLTSEQKSNDEVGILSGVFNEMMVKVKELLEKVRLEQKQKREYELALIQSQMKPHFFYNTLDLIFVQCEMGQSAQAADTTKALADFYKISLSKGKETITIREELKNAEDYLFIQKMLYSDIIDFRIEVSDEIMHYSIMKLTIQPLVENSIYHGLKPKMRQGMIIIRGYLQGDSVIIHVLDDGVGISGDRLKELLDLKSTEAAKISFGLRSVNERIKLYYGDEYGMYVRSESGQGTEITITLPRTMRGQEDV